MTLKPTPILWFLDTEFEDNGSTIDLISIAVVNERGDEYYAVSKEFVEADCSEWVKQNVLPHLPPRDQWKPRALIARELCGFMLQYGRPEIWSYFGSYDWVVFCQLWGRMLDLPEGMPHRINDIAQLMAEREISKRELPEQDPASRHSALADARWIRDAYRAIRLRREG